MNELVPSRQSTGSTVADKEKNESKKGTKKKERERKMKNIDLIMPSLAFVSYKYIYDYYIIHVIWRIVRRLSKDK